MPLKMKHILCWNVPYITPLKVSFPSLFENVVLRSLKSFFQSDHQVDISLYITRAPALHHFRKLVGLKPCLCTFNPISLFGFSDCKINCFHCLYVCPLWVFFFGFVCCSEVLVCYQNKERTNKDLHSSQLPTG